MRPSVFAALLAALVFVPAAALSQTGDAGPDKSMAEQARAAHRDLPTQAEREAGEDSHADADCGGKSEGGPVPNRGRPAARPAAIRAPTRRAAAS